MTKSNENKKLVLSSLGTVALCGTLLLGSTFAWFTDKEVNNNNKIESGTLDIELTAQQLTYIDNGTNQWDQGEKIPNWESGDAFITETNWEPGMSNARQLKITNNGTLAADIDIDVIFNDEGLENALWVRAEIVSYDEKNVKLATDTIMEKGPMSDFDEAMEKFFAENQRYQLLAGENQRLKVFYGMNEEAGNEYQGKSFSADFTVNAKQSVHENNGQYIGGDNHDENATYINAGQVNLPNDVVDALDKADTTAAKKEVLVDAGIVSAGTSNLYVDMIAEGQFDLRKGITLGQGSEATVNLLSSYPTKSTITMTPIGESTTNITVNEAGKLVIKTSNSSGVHTYEVTVKDSKGEVIDAYEAKFMSINLSGPDAVNASGILSVSDNQTISFNGNNGKQITQYAAIKDEIVNVTITSSDTDYVTINSCDIIENTEKNTGNFNVNLNVLKALESDTKVYVKAQITLSDGSNHYISLGSLRAKNISK